MTDLHVRIRAAQVAAGEDAVMRDLRSRGLADAPPDHRQDHLDRLTALAEGLEYSSAEGREDAKAVRWAIAQFT